MQVQRMGQDLVVVLPPDIAQRQGLQEGDEVMVMKITERTAFERALRQALRDHAGTFEFL